MSESGDSQSSEGDSHHPQYYFSDGSAIFQLCPDGQPGLLYKLHASVLGFRSAIFKTVFSLPRGPNVHPDIRTEGASDSKPYQVAVDAQSARLRPLIVLYLLGTNYASETDDFLISVLKLSTFFQIQDGIAHAVQEFELKGRGFDPTLQFELARRYRIDHWIEPAFHRLMEIPLTDLDMPLMTRWGIPGFFWLVKTKAEVEKHRKQFLSTHPQSSMTRAAIHRLSAVWYGLIVHHPNVQTSLVDLLNSLRDTEITGLCDGCRKRTVSWIWGTGYATVEGDLVDKAVATLMALQTDEPIRAALSKNAIRFTSAPPSPSSSTPPI
ncbi:hypothetical protein B0H14DRAFT_3750143 [Mycena olivaceomarginata]|nr:hypothetical protein B0H14DRAFT_3750143 [Mycena olivaceomarginata]